MISIPGFIVFNQCRRQKFERRSGGISVYVKENISKYFSCINTESDYVLWFSIDKNFTGTSDDIIFGAVYIPHENSRFLINDELMTLEMEITNMCSKHQYVCLTGDFNGRTSILNDYLSADSFLTDILDFDSQTENFFNSVANLENFSKIGTEILKTKKKQMIMATGCLKYVKITIFLSSTAGLVGIKR